LAALIVCVDLDKPIDINSVSLFNSEGMSCGFQFDVWARAVIPQMSPSLEVLGAGIEREFG
jgi:hypothetical protein